MTIADVLQETRAAMAVTTRIVAANEPYTQGIPPVTVIMAPETTTGPAESQILPR